MKINILEKKIRSEVIKDYMQEIGISKAVVFTCGNAAKYLKKIGVEVLAIGEYEDLKPNKWFTHEEIGKKFKGYFNATSGDIPLFLIYKIGQKIRKIKKNKFKGGEIEVGSGETLLVMIFAYPELKNKIIPIRTGSPETKCNGGATLNPILKLLYPNFIEKQI